MIKKSQELRLITEKLTNNSNVIINETDHLKKKLMDVVKSTRKKKIYFYDTLFLKSFHFIKIIQTKYLTILKNLRNSSDDLIKFEKNYKYYKRKLFFKQIKQIQEMIKITKKLKQRIKKLTHQYNCILNDFKDLYKM